MLGEEAAQRHHYADQAAAAEGGGALPALRKKLMKEAKELQRGDLPLHVNAAIFVRQDEGHMDVWRAVLSGPVDTPYALGLFSFDLFCPPEYPAIPPLVHLETTAGGTVKFNPNLYADGKVPPSPLASPDALPFIHTHATYARAHLRGFLSDTSQTRGRCAYV